MNNHSNIHIKVFLLIYPLNFKVTNEYIYSLRDTEVQNKNKTTAMLLLIYQVNKDLCFFSNVTKFQSFDTHTQNLQKEKS